MILIDTDVLIVSLRGINAAWEWLGEHGFEVAALNTKHFPMFDDLQPPFDL